MSGLATTNAAAFRRAVKTGFASLELTSEDEVAGLAKDMAELMREGAPEMDSTERRRRQSTEAGRQSVRRTPGKRTIRFRRGRDRQGFFCDVGPSKGAFYLAFQEWGTSKMPPRPFLRPAIEAAISRWATR